MTNPRSVRTAVIPAAGKGTRMMPLTKTIPKELLPVTGKPVLQFVIEEAIASDLDHVIIIIHPLKNAIKAFVENHPWNARIKFDFVYQHERKGLGDAILKAQNLVGHSPFAVMLGDNIIETEKDPLTAQLAQIYLAVGKSVVALEKVNKDQVSKYGIADPEKAEKEDVFKLKNVIEKPSPDNAPSNLAFASRYIFTPEIFKALNKAVPGYKNEVQLTDAMQLLLKEQVIYGFQFKGKRYDIGTPEDYLMVKKHFGDIVPPDKSR